MRPPKGWQTALVLTEAKQAFGSAMVAKQESLISTYSARLFNSQHGRGIGLVICLRRPADRWFLPELVLEYNGGNILQRFLHKPLESVYLSVGTHPYQRPCTDALWA